jgi:hypothetical protein
MSERRCSATTFRTKIVQTCRDQAFHTDRYRNVTVPLPFRNLPPVDLKSVSESVARLGVSRKFEGKVSEINEIQPPEPKPEPEPWHEVIPEDELQGYDYESFRYNGQMACPFCDDSENFSSDNIDEFLASVKAWAISHRNLNKETGGSGY